MTQNPRPPACERAGLLLSLRADDAATPDQERELDAHLPGCDACRRARDVDRAVGARLRFRTEEAAGPKRGFAARTAAAASLAARAAAASENRFLRIAAAAAVVVAVGAGSFLTLRPSPGRGFSPETAASARDAARLAVVPSRLSALSSNR